MPVPKLQDLALCEVTVKEALKADEERKGVLTRLLLAKIAEDDAMSMFRESLDAVQGHVCVLRTFNVWHGSLRGPRKFRNNTLCRCKCLRLGVLCECQCAGLVKMVMEFREAEPFRDYDAGRRKHKKCPRFISKKTKLGRLLAGQFEDPFPFTSF